MRNQEKSSKSYEKEITTKLKIAWETKKNPHNQTRNEKKGPKLQKKSLQTRMLQRNQNTFPKLNEKG